MDSYDSGKLTFKNESVVITDPGYLISKAHKDFDDIDVWEKCDYGSHMERIGFTKFFTSSNGFGDGCWTVTNKKNGKKLGEIWADSGQTGIYLLDEVAPDSAIFYPTIDGREFGAVILRNFIGTISWSFRKVPHENPEYTKIVNALAKMGITVDEAKKMGMKMDEPKNLWVSEYLLLQAIGTCGDQEIDFLVDFGFVDDEEE